MQKEIRLFGKWDYTGVTIDDAGLKDSISLYPMIYPHSFGRHAGKRFSKDKVNVVERLVNGLSHFGKIYSKNTGRMGGKKQRVIKTVSTAFDIIHFKTNKNPLDILVKAIINAGPNEDTTRISYGGTVYHVSVDVSPTRRIDLAIRYIAEGARLASFASARPFEETLADEIITAASGDLNSYPIKKKQDQERMAMASR